MINKLVENIKRTGAPIVVGLDPMLNYIPEQVQKKAFSEYGEIPKALQRQSGSSIKKSWTRLMILFRQ